MFKNQARHDPLKVALTCFVIFLAAPFAMAQETAVPEDPQEDSITTADLELLAKLPSDKRKKMLDLLQKAGISTIATDDVITAATNNLPVSEESGFILEDEDGNEIAAAVGTAVGTNETEDQTNATTQVATANTETGEPAEATGLALVTPETTTEPVETASLTPPTVPEQTVDQAHAEIPENLDLGVQTLLKNIGCYRGKVDGIWGRGSRAGVSRYFINKGIVRDSLEATEDLYRLLSVETGEVCKRVVAKAGSGGKKAPASGNAAAPASNAAPTIKLKLGTGAFR